MKNYKVLAACANCLHCLKIGVDWPYYYCNLDKSLPEYNGLPTEKEMCGNLFSTEEERKYTEEEYEKVFYPRCEIWHEWQKEHEVKPRGKCSLWESTIQELEEIEEIKNG